MDSILFILSFVMLFLGGEFLVKSSVAIDLKMRISTLVVGMTGTCMFLFYFIFMIFIFKNYI